MKKRKITILSSLVAAYAVFSTVIFASNKLVGEILVLSSADSPKIKVNGEVTQSGRTIFSESAIATDESSKAIISVRNVGKIELAPNTMALVSFNEKGIFVELSNGKVTALEGSNVSVKNLKETVKLNVGESASAQQQDDDDDGGAAWLLWGLLLGGAAAVAIAIAVSGSNHIQLGGGSTVVSPTR